MENIKSHMPELNNQINKISKRIDKGVSFDDIWTNITPESIDYGLMEKAKNIIVVKAKFDWSDLGSWNIIHDISPKNKDGNTIRGDALIIEGRNNFVQSNGKFIALLGLDNVVVITTDDATLVVAKDRVEEVKNVVKYLKDDKKENLL
jgi:mannose-1-phosphate guanylyltransferase